MRFLLQFWHPINVDPPLPFSAKNRKICSGNERFNILPNLPTETDESCGLPRLEIKDTVAFRNADFFYPERADAPAPQNPNLDIVDGECVATASAPGPGKSTTEAPPQRPHEPAAISIGPHESRSTNINHL